ncbi:MAG: Uncharacterized protein JWQ07_4759 [Ramlibacter sp.]|nr:Uncharacterized protein [Ramlibacter sp.]
MISYALIEQNELSRSPTQRARRGILRSYKNVHSGTFEGKFEFTIQLQAAMGQLFREPEAIQKMLIISAHGVPLTGTQLASRSGETQNEDLIELWDYNDHFKVAPANLTVFLSSCWGAYREVARAIQHNAHPCPVVVGPLVNVQFGHAQEMQACLLRALDGIHPQTDVELLAQQRDGLVRVRNALAPAYKRFNNRRFRSAYHQRHVLGIHFPDGNFYPKRGADMPAAAVEEVRGILHELRVHEGGGIRPVYGDSRGRILVGLVRHHEEFTGSMGVLTAEYELCLQILDERSATGELVVHILKARKKGASSKTSAGPSLMS